MLRKLARNVLARLAARLEAVALAARTLSEPEDGVWPALSDYPYSTRR